MHTSFPVVSPLDEAMPVQATAAPIAIPSLSARCAKRAFDLIGALFSLVFLSPVLLVIILLQWFTSGGPAFFRQERIGKNGRPFKILKFRTMRVDAEENGPQLTQIDDTCRCTPIGGFLRRHHLDELPQLWNVLRGEMSFVGPRPEREFFIKQLEKEIMYYNLRHTVKPGLTGWAQVMYPYGASIEDAYRKLQYDLYYIKNHDILFDMKILLKTVTIVIFGKGR